MYSAVLFYQIKDRKRSF